MHPCAAICVLPSQIQTNDKKKTEIIRHHPISFRACSSPITHHSHQWQSCIFRPICNCWTVTVPVITRIMILLQSYFQRYCRFISFSSASFLLSPHFFVLLLRRSCLEILHLLLSMSAYYGTLILNTDFLCVVSFENCIYFCYFSRSKATWKMVMGAEREKEREKQTEVCRV